MECSISLSYVTSLGGDNTDVRGTDPDASGAGVEIIKKQEIKGNLYPPKMVEQKLEVDIPAAAVGALGKLDGEVSDVQGKNKLKMSFTFWFKNGRNGEDGKETMGNQVWVMYAMEVGQKDDNREGNEERFKGEVMLLRYFSNL